MKRISQTCNPILAATVAAESAHAWEIPARVRPQWASDAIYGARPDRAEVNAGASLLVAVLLGRLSQFVRSGLRANPEENWDEQWRMLARTVFVETPPA